ncbi:MAG: carboxypeptidase-like regulatory domain-containing protein [Bacteroidales bacterium]|jgi:hypothetical protein|nr:carboxypeptidase-like regulatory domain-containing protein [Bacteroidales bacterium]
MKRFASIKCILAIAGLTLSVLGISQQHVAGIIRDEGSGEVLIGANVFDPNGLNGSATDNNGYFNMVVGDNCDSLIVSYVGYKSLIVILTNKNDSIININLQQGSEIDEVQVLGYRKITFNHSQLSNKQLRYIPSIGAEPDVLKTLQLLPGIMSQNEGSSNLLVRGGGPGQNLFLIDNVPLYYVNHLGGFVSVFNPEVLNEVRVIKGGFPAKYGGKLSSVVDITMREGNQKEFKGSAGIGIMGADLTLEGPINDKTTYLFSVRKTFTELLFGAATFLQDDDYIATYGFYDMNGKLTWRPDDKNSIHANIYLGDDKFAITLYDSDDRLKMRNIWGNILGSMQWKRILNSRSSINSTLSYTKYRLKDNRLFEIYNSDGSLDFSFQSKYKTSVQDFTLKSEWKYRVRSAWEIESGLKSSYLVFVPNNFWDTEYNPKEDPEIIQGLESTFYMENHISVGSMLTMNLGFRGVNYLTNNYNDFRLEPRMDLSLSLSQSQKLNVSFMKVSQYANMVFSSGEFLNNEVWVPTQAGMNPSLADQYSFGWKGSFRKQMFTVETNVYWKKMENMLAFKEGYSNLKGDANWRSKLERGGEGTSYGAEFFLSKDKGTYTGFLSYAYSKTTRQFDNINLGREYVFEYDRPHAISFDLHRTLSKRLELNVLWVFQSGLPYTPAIGRAYTPLTGEQEPLYAEYEALIYGEKNSARMRPYHRMDVGLNLKTKTIKGRNETWTFSIYNLYSRQNPYFYYYNTRPGLNFSDFDPERYGFMKQYQLSFFPIIPSVSYKVDF